uniref:peptidyl-tRNA hydrolase n=1 Tax=Tabanus bromius TaxID=304241 RepID=A0A0K8TN48_TABBR
MSDENLDVKQLLNGIAVLLSFYAGYKYGLSVSAKSKKEASTSEEASGISERIFSSTGDYKMMLVVRNDLKMGKGKIAAQCGHASIGAYQNATKKTPGHLRRWLRNGCAKIAVKVESEAELIMVKRAAENDGLNTCVIRDAGRTQIEPNTMTVLAIGPAPSDEVDKITGHLRLL